MVIDPSLRLFDLLDADDNAPALIDGERRFSRARLRQAALAAAEDLWAMGLRPADALAIWLPNGAAWVQLLFAAAHLRIARVETLNSSRYHRQAPQSLPRSRAKVPRREKSRHLGLLRTRR
jgi:non-ribosomal peptide synthetase component E (peptide arylation enzyme)